MNRFPFPQGHGHSPEGPNVRNTPSQQMGPPPGQLPPANGSGYQNPQVYSLSTQYSTNGSGYPNPQVNLHSTQHPYPPCQANGQGGYPQTSGPLPVNVSSGSHHNISFGDPRFHNYASQSVNTVDASYSNKITMQPVMGQQLGGPDPRGSWQGNAVSQPTYSCQNMPPGQEQPLYPHSTGPPHQGYPSYVNNQAGCPQESRQGTGFSPMGQGGYRQPLQNNSQGVEYMDFESSKPTATFLNQNVGRDTVKGQSHYTSGGTSEGIFRVQGPFPNNIPTDPSSGVLQKSVPYGNVHQMGNSSQSMAAYSAVSTDVTGSQQLGIGQMSCSQTYYQTNILDTGMQDKTVPPRTSDLSKADQTSKRTDHQPDAVDSQVNRGQSEVSKLNMSESDFIQRSSTQKENVCFPDKDGMMSNDAVDSQVNRGQSEVSKLNMSESDFIQRSSTQKENVCFPDKDGMMSDENVMSDDTGHRTSRAACNGNVAGKDSFQNYRQFSVINDVTDGSSEDSHSDFEVLESEEIDQRTAQEETVSTDEGEDEKFYEDRFQLRGLPEVSEETVINYVEVVTQCGVEKVEYSRDLKTAVVFLGQACEEWRRIKRMVSKRPLERRKVEFDRLTIADRICVWGVKQDTKKDTLENYFVNCRSGNVDKIPISCIKMEETIAVVTFERPKAVEDILSRRRTHNIDGTRLEVSEYYKDVGPVKERSKVITEKTVYLRQHEIQLLKKLKLLDKMPSGLKQASVKDNIRVILEGADRDLEAAVQEIETFRGNIRSRKIDVSPRKMKYLQNKEAEEYVLKKLAKSRHVVAFEKTGNGLKVYSMSDDTLNKAERMIEVDLKERHLDVPPSVDFVALERKLDDVERNLLTTFEKGSFCLILCKENQHVYVVAQSGVRDSVVESISHAISELHDGSVSTEVPRCTKVGQMEEKTVTVDKAKKKFIERYMSQKISEVDFDFSGRETEIKIQGPRDAISRAEKIMHEVVQDILALEPVASDWLKSSLDTLESHVGNQTKSVIWHRVQEGGKDISRGQAGRPQGAEASFRSSGDRGDNGWCVVSKLDTEWPPLEKSKTVNSDERTGSSNVQYSPQDFRSNQQPDSGVWQQPKARTRTGRRFAHDKISVKMDDILKEKVDIIVCPVSVSKIEQGLLKIVLDKGKLHSEWRKQKKELKEGFFVQTKGGNLECKEVYFCCLPPRSSLNAGQLLGDVLWKMLKHAGAEGRRSIAIPALGNGALDYDPGTVANTLFSVIMRYHSKNLTTTLVDVRLVIRSQSVFMIFQDIQKTMRQSQTPGYLSSTDHIFTTAINIFMNHHSRLACVFLPDLQRP